jgi:RNA polymerase sigma-70 factor, ECF subfamily
MDRDMTDEALMLAYRDGDAQAFEALYRRYRGRLYRYLLHQCGNPATAEELYQDVWLKLINARRGYEVAAKFSTWLFRIAHNRLMDHFRSHARAALERYDCDDAAEPIDPPAAESGQPERMLERKVLARALLQQIERLPQAQREAFLLAQEGEMTLAEIAAATGVNRETAKSRLRYALDKLRAGLRDVR